MAKKPTDKKTVPVALTPTFSPDLVARIAKLAAIPVTGQEEADLAEGFNQTLAVVDKLFAVNVSGVEPTHQVTGLTNILREDEVDEQRTLSQEAALKNSRRTYNGYFVVDGILPDLS